MFSIGIPIHQCVSKCPLAHFLYLNLWISTNGMGQAHIVYISYYLMNYIIRQKNRRKENPYPVYYIFILKNEWKRRDTEKNWVGMLCV